MTHPDKTAEQLREETECCQEFLEGEFVDAPEAVPRAAEAEAVSIRLPKKMLTILREFARRQGIGYQVLIKRWLDDRIKEEAKTWLENHLAEKEDQ